MSKIKEFCNYFDLKETTTKSSPTKSVTNGPSCQSQQQSRVSRSEKTSIKNFPISVSPVKRSNKKSFDELECKSDKSADEDKIVTHRGFGNKMVAKQEESQVQTVEGDENDFKYGPGFVSKLKCRYLSLTLRQTSVAKQRPSLAQLRRSTSLNNLLDEEDHHEDEKQDTNGHREEEKAPATPPPSPPVHIRSSRSVDKVLNMKRARSVEAILVQDEVTIEDKIQSARERPPSLQPPKRLMSLIDDDERPPAGICKQTMRIFEASANKKRNLVARPIGQEIANKVAIFGREKPAVAPRNHLNNGKMNNNGSVAVKEKAVLPKLDINIIKNNLDGYRSHYSPALSDSSHSDSLRNSLSPQPVASPIITALSNKLNNLHMETSSTPKSWNNSKSNNLLKLIDDDTGGDKESVGGDKEGEVKMSFSPKINNNCGTNGKAPSTPPVKENFVTITKPTQAPPPPPPSYSSAMKSRETEKKLSEETTTPKWQVKKKSWAEKTEEVGVSNTIVFNFSDRKDVPDYIESDGLIMRRKRELPKPHESGFVLLGDLTLETSTDPDDAYQMGPPSPCDVEFENANIVPEGKSSIRSRVKEVKFKLQFDDSLTETFEYPSETSLLVEEWLGDDDEVDANFYGRATSTNSSKLMNSVPLGSTPFANYQPQKASTAAFELGITRTTPSPSSGSSEENTFISNPESDGEDYLKPATDEESQRWSSSEGTTRGTDLLF